MMEEFQKLVNYIGEHEDKDGDEDCSLSWVNRDTTCYKWDFIYSQDQFSCLDFLVLQVDSQSAWLVTDVN